MTSARYGLFLAVAIIVLTSIVPQPAGAIVLFALFTVQLSWGAVICWRRTGLPFMTATLVHGAVMSLSLVVLEASGHPLRDLAPESWVPYIGACVTGPLLMRIESRVNQTKWEEMARHMEDMTVWDIITGRHFPQLRDRGTSVP